MSRNERQFGVNDFLPIAAVVTIGIAAAVCAFVLTRGYYLAADRDEFQRNATDYGAAFKTGIERHVNSLAAIHAFVSSSHDVNRWEFSNFAHQILPQNSGFKAVLWLPHVAGAQRKAFEAALQSDGLFGLRVRELAADGALVPAADRDRYIPVAYVEPFEASGSLIGVDLAKDPIYAPLFQRARTSGKVVASAPLPRALIDGARAPLMLVVFPLGRGAAAQRMAVQRPDEQKGDVRKAGTQNTGAPPELEGYALGVLQLDRRAGQCIADAQAQQQGQAVGGFHGFSSDGHQPARSASWRNCACCRSVWRRSRCSAAESGACSIASCSSRRAASSSMAAPARRGSAGFQLAWRVVPADSAGAVGVNH